jgi:predicted GH43/DUF377 family glycosyl hydrolase
MEVEVKRIRSILPPDQTRVLLRPLTPGGFDRIAAIVSRILTLPEDEVEDLLLETIKEFSKRHHDIELRFLERFDQIRGMVPIPEQLSDKRRALIGAYFTAEYSIESAALFNPSIILHPDQDGLAPGAMRFILSLRAVGEGHISSITFRTGVIHPDNRIEVLEPKGFLIEPQQIPNARYERPLFQRTLGELGVDSDFSRQVLGQLGDSFTLEELGAALHAETSRLGREITQEDQEAAHGMWMLARSNYEVQFQPEQDVSERILFPATPAQSNGIEDARFVRFEDDDGSIRYYATFTAYDGRIIMPELVTTTDFLKFRFSTLNGPAAKNKGMALFPRKIGGRYAMLSRQDNENLYLMYSENIHFWNESRILLKPRYAWELTQIGNCGSPIETDAGWLVLSHGVGPMRTYSIGAFLLDKDDPSKVIGRLREPLIRPSEYERAGYVPNVAYTCGALVHEGELIIPYGISDYSTTFATIPIDTLLDAIIADGGGSI